MSDIEEATRPILSIVPEGETSEGHEKNTPPNNPLSEVAQRLSRVEGVDRDKVHERLLALQSRLKDRLDRELSDRSLGNSSRGTNLSTDPAIVAEQLFGEFEIQGVDSSPLATPLEHPHRKPLYIDAYQNLAQGDFAQVAAILQALGVADGRGITGPDALEQLGHRNAGGFSDYNYYADAGIDYGDGRTAEQARTAIKKEGEVIGKYDVTYKPAYDVVKVSDLATQVPGYKVDYMAQIPVRGGPRDGEATQYVVLLHPDGEMRAKIALSEAALSPATSQAQSKLEAMAA